jgi:hypothetical protein
LSNRFHAGKHAEACEIAARAFRRGVAFVSCVALLVALPGALGIVFHWGGSRGALAFPLLTMTSASSILEPNSNPAPAPYVAAVLILCRPAGYLGAGKRECAGDTFPVAAERRRCGKLLYRVADHSNGSKRGRRGRTNHRFRSAVSDRRHTGDGSQPRITLSSELESRNQKTPRYW